jgi:hypothetical protein
MIFKASSSCTIMFLHSGHRVTRYKAYSYWEGLHVLLYVQIAVDAKAGTCSAPLPHQIRCAHISRATPTLSCIEWYMIDVLPHDIPCLPSVLSVPGTDFPDDQRPLQLPKHR